MINKFRVIERTDGDGSNKRYVVQSFTFPFLKRDDIGFHETLEEAIKQKARLEAIENEKSIDRVVG